MIKTVKKSEVKDDRFMIKTVKKSEVKVLIRMLPSFYKHVCRYGNSLVTKFYGVHCVKPIGGQKVLFVPMLAPRSYTREDVVELQCHGSDVCLRRVLRACLEAGASLTKPGEFTLRAFLNGRLDLTQAENVDKLVSAKSVAAADASLAGIQGGFSLVNSLIA